MARDWMDHNIRDRSRGAIRRENRSTCGKYITPEIAAATQRARAPAATLHSSISARAIAPRRTLMNRDEIKGKAEKAKGYVKDKAGELLNNPELEAEGEAERAVGTAREAVGKAKRKVREGIEDVAEKIEER